MHIHSKVIQENHSGYWIWPIILKGVSLEIRGVHKTWQCPKGRQIPGAMKSGPHWTMMSWDLCILKHHSDFFGYFTGMMVSKGLLHTHTRVCVYIYIYISYII